MSDHHWSVSGADGLEPDRPAPAPARPVPQVGERFGPYRIGEELGRGGMGVVLRARDLDADRDVALKVVLCDLDPEHLARFEREGQITAALQHPGIVRVHAAGEVDGRPFLAYELVEEARPVDHDWATLPLEARVGRVLDAARALGHAHAQGVVHRDVKAANVLLDGAGRVRVTDFGLAAAQSLERLTQTGAMIGTPIAMAPEQMHGDEAVGPPADVWSLGVLLYRALTGARPFPATTLVELSAQITTARPTPPRALVPSLPLALEVVCLRALARDPADRQPDATALARELERALGGEAPGRDAALGRWIGAAVLALALVLLAASWPDDPQRGWGRRAETIRQDALRLLRGRGALRPHAAQVAALQSQVAALEAEGASGPLLDEVRATTGALRGLTELALARVDVARRVAASLPPSALERLLDAALRTESEIAPPQARAIGEALTPVEGCRFAELQVWRARAAAASEVLSEADARRALDALAGHARRPDRIARARLLGRLGRTVAARDAVRGLPDLPRDLVVDLAWRSLPSLSASGALAALDADRITTLELAALPLQARAVLRDRHLRDAAQQLSRARLSRTAPEPNYDTLRLARRLVDAPLPPDLLQALLSHYRLQADQGASLALTISDLAPRSFEVHLQLVQRLQGVPNPTILTATQPVFDRALALAPGQVERDAIGVVQVFAYSEGKQDAACLALAEQLLTRVEGEQRGLVHKARGHSRERLGDLTGALADYRAATRLLPRHYARLGMHQAYVLEALGRGRAAAAAALTYAVGASRSSKLTDAVRLVWTHLRTEQPRDVSRAVEHLLNVHPDWPGWWVRAAWMRLAVGKPAREVAAALETGARGLATLRRFPQAQALAPAAARLAERLRAEPAASLRAPLQALVDALEAIRAGNAGP